MTARKLLDRITSYGVTLAVRDGRLVVNGRPTHRTRLLIGAHRAALVSVLSGHDVDLTTTRTPAFLASVGAVQLETGAWTHSLGDDHLEAILCGDVTFEDARAEASARDARARREAHAFGVSALRDVFGHQLADAVVKAGRYPGHTTYVIEHGKRYRKLPSE
jgi:hypothetical protein